MSSFIASITLTTALIIMPVDFGEPKNNGAAPPRDATPLSGNAEPRPAP